MGGGSSSCSRRWGRPCCANIAPRILRKPVPQCGLGAHFPKKRDPNPSGIGRGRLPYGVGHLARNQRENVRARKLRGGSSPGLPPPPTPPTVAGEPSL